MPAMSLGDAGYFIPTRSVFGVGAMVASFVSTECPVDRGMWGISPLKELFGDVWATGGLRNHIFPKVGRYR